MTALYRIRAHADKMGRFSAHMWQLIRFIINIAIALIEYNDPSGHYDALHLRSNSGESFQHSSWLMNFLF